MTIAQQESGETDSTTGGTVDLLNDGSSDANDLVMRSTGTAPSDQWSFKPNPNNDGSFQIVNNIPSKSGCAEVDDNGYVTMATPCEASDQKQLFYAEPDTSTGSNNTYLIRRVDNNQCVSSHWSPFEAPYAGGAARQMNTIPCASAAGRNGAIAPELWTVTAAPGDGASGPTLDDLATQYAATQVKNGSGVIKESSYSITDSQPAALGPYQLVSTGSVEQGSSPVCVNGAQPGEGDLTCTMTWSQSSADSISETDTIGVQVQFGVNTHSPLKDQVQIAYQHQWGESSTTTTTSGTADAMYVKPGETAWLVRAVVLKTTTGDWTFKNDVGSTWTHHGTVTLPVDTMDNVHSPIEKCTLKSTEAPCTSTRPSGL
ncbi:hypothetical protein [Streptomyces tubercidicus]|uniref:hypothetical protein n=1 Tax=Streptomyces tubercidicus TaxID=47759 RepID=UPI0036BD9A5E